MTSYPSSAHPLDLWPSILGLSDFDEQGLLLEGYVHSHTHSTQVRQWVGVEFMPLESKPKVQTN